MADPGQNVPGWRARWAAKENANRQRSFQTAAQAWGQRRSDLAGMHAAAVGFRGSPHGGGTLPIDLKRGELVYLTLPAAQMVEAPQGLVLPPPTAELRAVPAEALTRPLPDSFKVMDAGTVVVTDRRVVFLGARAKREWAFAKMVGLLSDPFSPFTLMHVVNRQRVSGVYLPSASAPGFRFNLTLALADAWQRRQTIVAQLDGLLAAHHQARPIAPPLAAPADAPATARVPGGKVSIAALALFLLCGFAGLVADPTPQASPAASVPTQRTSAPADALVGGMPDGAPSAAATAAASPATSTSTATAKPTPVKSPTRGPSKSPTPRPKRTTASPTPKKIDLCGAPQNPYGYNFCSGSKIYDPAADVCSYFNCIDNFDNGRGYMMQCKDGMVSMSGGRSGSCSHHGGNRRAVLK